MITSLDSVLNSAAKIEPNQAKISQIKPNSSQKSEN